VTNVYIYVDDGRKCAGIGKNNFEFDHWVQNLSRSSSLTIKEPSGETSNYLTVDRYGNFTANFKLIPPPAQVTIPSDFLYGVVLGPTVGAVLGVVLGWYIPYLINKRSTNKDTNKSKRKQSSWG
jgi:hypothetical protein